MISLLVYFPSFLSSCVKPISHLVCLTLWSLRLTPSLKKGRKKEKEKEERKKKRKKRKKDKTILTETKEREREREKKWKYNQSINSNKIQTMEKI